MGESPSKIDTKPIIEQCQDILECGGWPSNIHDLARWTEHICLEVEYLRSQQEVG